MVFPSHDRGRESNPTGSTKTESWNGSAWTEVNDLSSVRVAMGSTTGTPYTAALSFGGTALPIPQQAKALTESWNGTSWTEVNDLNMGRSYIGGFGTQTSALAFGGYGPTPPASYRQFTESWNGTSWTEVNDFNTPATGAMGS